MRNDDDSLPRDQLRDGALDEDLVLRVDVRCCLVEDDNGGILQHGARDGDALALASRELTASAADNGIIAVGKLLDEVGAARKLCRTFDLCIGR